MGNVYWYYLDKQSWKCYYTESYKMSVTDFADIISGIIGRKIYASETSAARCKQDLNDYNTIYIGDYS